MHDTKESSSRAIPILDHSIKAILKNPFIIFLIGFGLSFWLYLFTSAKGIVWGDSAKLTLFAIDREINWASISTHPIHTLFSGWALDIFHDVDPATIVNNLSGFFAAIGIGICGVISQQICKRSSASYLTIFTLTFSHTYWSLGVVAESYSTALCFGSLILFLLIISQESKLLLINLLAGVISGLSIGVNALTIIALPCFIHLQLKGYKDTKWISKLLSYFIGSITGLLLIKFLAFALSGTNLNLVEITTRVSGEGSEYIRGFDIRKALMFLPNLIYQFPWLIFILIIFIMSHFINKNNPIFISKMNNGFKAINWNQTSLLIGIISVLIFSSSYQYQRHFVFLSYPFLFSSILIGCWLSNFLNRINPMTYKLFLIGSIPLINISFYALIYRLPKIGNILKTRSLPGRNDSYFFQPWKHNLSPSASEWSKNWLSGLPEDSIVLADFTVARVLQYTKRSLGRKDILVLETDSFLFINSTKKVEDFIDFISQQLSKGKPVYLGDMHPTYYFLSEISEKFTLITYGNGARILPKERS